MPKKPGSNRVPIGTLLGFTAPCGCRFAPEGITWCEMHRNASQAVELLRDIRGHICGGSDTPQLGLDEWELVERIDRLVGNAPAQAPKRK